MSKMTLAALAAVAMVAPVSATAVVGQPAPAFTARDSTGQVHNLSDFRGRTVVLEWTNADCPFVVKFYQGGQMQRLQQQARAQGVVWLTVNSGAPGNQGHMTPAQANAKVRAQNFQSTAYIPDADGAIGRAYGARTTPHMFVIDPRGTLVYAGGIDDRPTANPADIQGARNFVSLALADIAANRPVQVSTSRPYGCSVKY